MPYEHAKDYRSNPFDFTTGKQIEELRNGDDGGSQPTGGYVRDSKTLAAH